MCLLVIYSDIKIDLTLEIVGNLPVYISQSFRMMLALLGAELLSGFVYLHKIYLSKITFHGSSNNIIT